VVHDACEIWAAVAIDDFSGEVVGWRNPPTSPVKLSAGVTRLTGFGRKQKTP